MLQRIYSQYKNVVAYLIFGGLTTAMNFILFGLLTLPAINCPYLISNVLAWFGSILFAYTTNRRWVFDSQANTFQARFREVVSFFGYRVLSLGVDELIMFIGISLLAGNGLIVKLIDQIIIVLINWIFSKYFIFKN
ncbi:GtrA family protein [Lactiplantibacillus xiangfangensis]|uniref:Teichoic acid glycosylation protein n=1 Tax=Lactiplantibacillus xiangfangensis TaxID=942150 RepID=A0A0R2MH11_9LACO|nr:GtrA family protein [Lactiplantibacillus xiangfangensis]KRO11756.1 teichoic acid glycosylation protein [Lactiplantibacillus xiangfangensis]